MHPQWIVKYIDDFEQEKLSHYYYYLIKKTLHFFLQ